MVQLTNLTMDSGLNGSSSTTSSTIIEPLVESNSSSRFVLVQLTPNQCQTNWVLIKRVLEETLPPVYLSKPDLFTHILDSLIDGTMQVWSGVRGGQVLGMVVTSFVDESMLGQKNLLLFSLYGFYDLPPSAWQSGYATLRDFARCCECSNIIGYTDREEFAALIRKLGGSTRLCVRLEV